MAPGVIESPRAAPMKAAEKLGQKGMGYFVRPLRMEDIAQVAQVERECFPTGWVATPFKRELQNRNAAYLVACQAADPSQAEEEARRKPPSPEALAHGSFLSRLKEWLRGLSGPASLPQADDSPPIVGFVGLWFLLDEAHITVIGVRERDRRKGIGELLVAASVELALHRPSRIVTLETRVSNYPAQALYLKYGFDQTGIRKGYYTDNREDAMVMSTGVISAPDYLERLQRLVREHAQRWGQSVRLLA